MFFWHFCSWFLRVDWRLVWVLHSLAKFSQSRILVIIYFCVCVMVPKFLFLFLCLLILLSNFWGALCFHLRSFCLVFFVLVCFSVFVLLSFDFCFVLVFLYSKYNSKKNITIRNNYQMTLRFVRAEIINSKNVKIIYWLWLTQYVITRYMKKQAWWAHKRNITKIQTFDL